MGKIKDIDAMPRTTKKAYLRDSFYCNSQSEVNVNLKIYAQSSVNVKVTVIEKQLRSRIYTASTSAIVALFM